MSSDTCVPAANAAGAEEEITDAPPVQAPAPIALPAQIRDSQFRLSAAQMNAVEWFQRQSIAVALYGAPKLGKTTDMLYAFAEGAHWFADAQALWPSSPIVGFMPTMDRISPSVDLDTTLTEIRKIKRGSVRVIVIDDASLQAANTERKYRDMKMDTFAMWTKLDQTFNAIIQEARNIGASVVFSGHESPADPKKGKMLGTFQLPSQRMSNSLPAVCSIVLRAVPDMMRKNPGSAYVAGADGRATGWITGDRTHVVRAQAPLNIAEILRASGIPAPRPAQYEAAIESAVSQSFDWVMSGANRREVVSYVHGAICQPHGWTDPMIRWYLRDLRDRQEIRSQPSTLSSMLADF